MQTRVTSPIVWCCDDLAVKQLDPVPGGPKIVLDLRDAQCHSAVTLLMTQTAAEALYAALWAALADEANAGVGLCDLTEVARMGDGDDGQQLVCG